MSPTAQKIIVVIGTIVAAIGPLLLIFGTLASSIGSIIGLVGIVGPIIAGLTVPFGAIIAIVAGVIALGVLLYKNWDLIKAKAIAFKDNVVATFNNFKTQVMTTFNNIKTAIITPIQTAISTIKNIIHTIKSWFPIKIGNIFSNIKLPHFKLTGKFSLKDMTVPKLSVEWYAQGGIFDAPTIAGIGEAGPEAVVPLNKFWDKLDRIAEGANASPIVINVYGSDNMSVTELAAAVEQRIIEMQKRRTLAWQ